MTNDINFKNECLQNDVLITKENLIELGFKDMDPYLSFRINKHISLQFHCYEHDDDFITLCFSHKRLYDSKHSNLINVKTLNQVKLLIKMLKNEPRR
ncbi:MAG: hypothetical protein WD512_09150 [Candidatus Paceibacterota bacterium]